MKYKIQIIINFGLEEINENTTTLGELLDYLNENPSTIENVKMIRIKSKIKGEELK